jgi:rhodanese-related sulfurtransferase
VVTTAAHSSRKTELRSRMNQFESASSKVGEQRYWFKTALRDAIIVTIACTGIASTVNAVRRDGIAFIRRNPYEIIVPCPVTTGEIKAVNAADLKNYKEDRLVIDARSRSDYKRWHIAEAMNVPFDYLEPTDPKIVHKIASSNAKEVVIYGDGNNPDSGEQLAKEIAGKGIRNVAYIAGGSKNIEGTFDQRSAR